MPRLAALLAALLVAAPAGAGVIVVDSGTDDGAGCTLREAIEAANSDGPVGGCAGGAGADIVSVEVPTVTLTQGEVVVRSAVRLRGPATVVAAPGDRAFRVAPSPDGPFSVTLVDVSVRGGEEDGGALFVEAGSVRVLRGTFSDNQAPEAGGAVYVSFRAGLEVVGTTFRANTARGFGGGAIFTEGGPVALREAVFTENRSRDGGDGGAIMSLNGAALSATSCRFLRNLTVRDGGAIAAIGGSLQLRDTEFTLNQAEAGRGGAVFANDVVDVDMRGGAVERNRAVSGGGFWLGSDAVLSVAGTPFRSNRATRAGPTTVQQGGGALYVNGSTVLADGVEFARNVAAGSSARGGAVLLRGGALEARDGTRFLNNEADTEGGAVWAARVGPTALSFTDVDFALNRVTSATAGRAGALYAVGPAIEVSVVRGTFDRNTSAYLAGAFWMRRGTLTMGGTRFVGNEAVESSGAGTFGDGTAEFVGVTMSGNRADQRPTKGFGGAFLFANADVAIRASTFEDNVGRSGGAVDLREGAVVTVSEGSVFRRNTARAEFGRGGAFHVQDATLRVLDSAVSENVAKNGGAVWSFPASTVELYRSAIHDNAAAQNGGALYDYRGALPQHLVVEQCLFLRNRTNGSGGALYSTSSQTATVRNSTFVRNEAGGTGGAIAAGGLSLLVEASSFADNTGGGGSVTIATGGTEGTTLRGVALRGRLTGSLASGGYNVIDPAPGASTLPPQPTDQLGVDPQFLPLADNGGPTRTLALASGSPAIDAGASGLDVDQRGFARDAQPDAGAFEVGATAPPTAEGPVAGLEAPVPGLDVFPNPASGRATVRLAVEATQHVTVSVYDVAGRRALTLFDGVLEGGLEARIPVEASGLAAGVYVVVAEGETVRASTRLSVLR